MIGRRQLVLSNLLVGALIAAGVAWLLYRTDDQRLARETNRPYMTMEIVPDSLRQGVITGTSQWGLFYVLRALKQASCDEILIERFVHRLGEPAPIATNRDIHGEIVSAGPEKQITGQLYVRLVQPLDTGDYFLLLRSTCYVIEEGERIAMTPPAEAYICFHVPDQIEAPLRQRIRPISANCNRELSQITVRPLSRNRMLAVPVRDER